ncbi:MAG: SDR family NAD(P)-dependent oxidoreductase [Beutenbergiaceae bacterium]
MGRRALVTGGGQGIGLAVVRRLTQAGVHCTVFDRNQASRDEVVAATGPAPADFACVDVTDTGAVAAAVATASAIAPFDVVVTSAGVALHGSSLEVTEQEWKRVLDVNTTGTFWVVREAARHMIAAGRAGSVVMIGSMSGDIANAPQAQSAYNASKGAVHVLAKCLAIEWATEDIRVNAVAPGFVGTELTRQGVDPEWIAEWERRTPQQRMGTPAEIAELVEFVSSERASYMTGSVVTIDGGYTAW